MDDRFICFLFLYCPVYFLRRTKYVIDSLFRLILTRNKPENITFHVDVVHRCENLISYKSHELASFLIRMYMAVLHSLTATDIVNRIWVSWSKWRSRARRRQGIVVLDNWNKDAPYQEDLCVGCSWEILVRESFCTFLRTGSEQEWIGTVRELNCIFTHHLLKAVNLFSSWRIMYRYESWWSNNKSNCTQK